MLPLSPTCRPAIPLPCLQLREALHAQAVLLLEGFSAEGDQPALQLLGALSRDVWPGLPATSAPHLSLVLRLVLACVKGVKATSPSLAALIPRLSKLCDLLDKAGGPLRGLAIKQASRRCGLRV